MKRELTLFLISSFCFLFLFFGQPIFPQGNRQNSKSLYIGFEPFTFAIGTKGLFLDYRVNDKIVYNFYGAYQSWWVNRDEIPENGKYPLSDYYLASRGPVFRAGLGLFCQKTIFSFRKS